MEYVGFWLILAVIVGIAASRRGRSGVGWFFLAAVVSPLLAGLLLFALGRGTSSLGGASPETHVRCPDCRELVFKDAKRCKHCGITLVPQFPYEQR